MFSRALKIRETGFLHPETQCCGSGMISSRIPDPAKFHSGSRIPDPESRIRIPDPGSYYIRKKGKFLKLLPRAKINLKFIAT
jgi:hypothetical protein